MKTQERESCIVTEKKYSGGYVKGSLTHIARSLNLSRETVFNSIRSLINANLISSRFTDKKIYAYESSRGEV